MRRPQPCLWQWRISARGTISSLRLQRASSSAHLVAESTLPALSDHHVMGGRQRLQRFQRLVPGAVPASFSPSLHLYSPIERCGQHNRSARANLHCIETAVLSYKPPTLHRSGGQRKVRHRQRILMLPYGASKPAT